MPRRAHLVPLVAFALAGLGLGAASSAATPIIDVVFNADGGLTVTYGGAPLGSPSAPGTVIPAGAYDVIVDNSLGDVGITFTLTGPGVDLQTDVDGGESATETWPETLQPNSTYTFQDASAPGTSQVFSTSSSSVGQAPTTTTTSATGSAIETNGPTSGSTTTTSRSTATTVPAPVPLRGTLEATVAADGALSLRDKGKPVASLPAGRYTITVDDHSKTSGFTLQEVRDPALILTTAPFVGERTTTVTLGVGQWVFYPSFVGAKTYFIVIS